MSNLVSVDNTIVTTTDVYSYHGFNVYIHSVQLNTSAIVRVSIAYLKNGEIDGSCRYESKDDKYGYMNRYVEISGSDYAAWGNDDNYILNYVESNFTTILNSTFAPRHDYHFILPI